MAEVKEIYKCEICGNIVEVLHGGAGQLVCCGQPMKKMEEKSSDQGAEKHVPVVEKTELGITVKVGSVAHPMEAEHHIEWIELVANGQVFRKTLNPGDAPQAAFNVVAESVQVRSYCNLHGLWKA